MKNQNNNRKKTHTTYSITNTHTHINIDKYTQKWTGQFAFWSSFLCPNLDGTCISPLVSQNGAWTALKPPPNVLKNPHEPAFHPWVFPKRSLESPKTTPNQKKKIPKKKKEFPKQFRTHWILWCCRSLQTWSGPCLSWIRRDSCGNFKWHHAFPSGFHLNAESVRQKDMFF